MIRRRMGWLLLTYGLILGALGCGRVLWVARSLKGHYDQLRVSASRADVVSTCDTIGGMQEDLAALRGEAGWLAALAPSLGWAPLVGSDLAAAPHLLNAAGHLADAGSLVCDALTRSGVREASLGEVMSSFAENQATIQQAAAAVDLAQQAMADVRGDTFSPGLSPRVQIVQRALPLLDAGLHVAVFTESLGGFDQPRTFLVLGLNEDELRPGGGFISGVGQVRIEGGRIATMEFRDSYAADDFSKPYPDPPEPLGALLGIDQWVFRDSNWSPDFPTAAKQAIALYRAHSPAVPIDGVIAVDQYALQEIIAALGSLQVPDSNEPITGTNVVSYMRHAWAPSDGSFTGTWWLKRKSFMSTLAEAARHRIEAGAFDQPALGQTLLRLLEGKHVQVFVNQPEVAALLGKQGWDGALQRTTRDYLMVIDANVGYNKANARIQQRLTYQVDLRAEPPKGEITLVYTNTVTANYPCLPETRYDPVYEQMMDRCYWNYVRVYVPTSARLDDATRIPIPASARWRKTPDPGAAVARAADEGGFQSLEAEMVLPTDSSQTRHYALTLSDNMVEWEGNKGQYSLYVQKQAGATAYPVAVAIRLPEGSVLLNAQPQPVLMEDGSVSFRLSLDRDVAILVRFQRQR